MRIGISALGQLSEDTGGRTYIINFVRTCIEMKLPHEFFIFYCGPKEDVWGELPPNFHKITVPFSYGSSWAKGFGLQLVLPFCIIGRKLDVIYFTNNFASVLCFKPYVLAVRSTLYYHFPGEVPPFKRLYRKTVSRWSARFARKILVPSASIARDIVRFMGVPPEKITVVPHGVETDRFAKRPSETEIDARLATMGLRRPYFLFVSALWRYKGADKFIAALKLLRERTGRADLWGAIVGKGIGAEESSRQLRASGGGIRDAWRCAFPWTATRTRTCRSFIGVRKRWFFPRTMRVSVIRWPRPWPPAHRSSRRIATPFRRSLVCRQ